MLVMEYEGNFFGRRSWSHDLLSTFECFVCLVGLEHVDLEVFASQITLWNECVIVEVSI
jgi:hypothetical protein